MIIETWYWVAAAFLQCEWTVIESVSACCCSGFDIGLIVGLLLLCYRIAVALGLYVRRIVNGLPVFCYGIALEMLLNCYLVAVGLLYTYPIESSSLWIYC